MSITVEHESDGSIRVTCGNQTIKIEVDGRPVTTKQPVILKPRGDGAGYVALDILLRGRHNAQGDEVELQPDVPINIDTLLEAGEAELEMER